MNQQVQQKIIKLGIINFILFIYGITQAQVVDYTNITFDNRVYHTDIASVKIGVIGSGEKDSETARAKTIGASNLAFYPPVIHLNTGDQIKLTFDDLSSEIKYMRYTLIHCTYDWKPTTSLNVNEYLTRFTEEEIINYNYSRTTLQPYVFYTVNFPNDNIQIGKSGNYLLYVYEDQGGKIIPLITRRIRVVENLATVTPSILQSYNVNQQFTHQEIDFQIDLNNQRLNNPANNIKVLIMQNERYDNALLITKPYINQGNILLYNERGGITMEGGNEFRVFNIKSLRTTMEGVEKIISLDDKLYAILYTEEDKHYKSYENNIDINGYYFNETIDYNTIGDADYAYVRFRLKYDKPIKGSIYVFGELTDWQLLEKAKLKYMDYAKTWQTELYLKSGYYNYIYLFVPEGSKIATADLIEGSHWETENRYTFFVYYKSDPSSYDRIIGYTSKYSFPKNK